MAAKFSKARKWIIKKIRKTKRGKKVVDSYRRKKKTALMEKISRENEINPKKIIFSAFAGRKYCCSPKAIYEYMISNPDFADYEFVWGFVNPASKEHFFHDERTKLVKYITPEFFKELAQSKYWIFNFKTYKYFYKKEGQIFVQCWHGTPLKRLGCDISIKNGSKASSLTQIHTSYHNDSIKYDYFLSPSQFATEKFETSFDLRNLNKTDIILEMGYPRNEALFTFDDEKVLKIKEDLGIPLDKKVILYAPTFRDNQYKKGKGHTYELGMNPLRWKDELSDEYVVLMRLHYLVSNSIDISQFKGFAIDVSDYDDINDLYIVSDLLITDYSSVFFDFADLKRPILFYMYDLDQYKNNIRDFYISLKKLPGPISKTERGLFKNIHNIEQIKEDYAEKYQAFNDEYNYLDNAHVTEKVVKEFMQE